MFSSAHYSRQKLRRTRLVDAWLDDRFELVSSAAQIDEITRVARYPKVRQHIAPA